VIPYTSISPHMDRHSPLSFANHINRRAVEGAANAVHMLEGQRNWFASQAPNKLGKLLITGFNDDLDLQTGYISTEPLRNGT
jgi:hypothetical protein